MNNDEFPTDIIPALPKDLLGKLSDENVGELYLGIEDERDRKLKRQKNVIHKLVAVCLWVVTSYMWTKTNQNNIFNEIEGLALFGLLLIFLSKTELLSRFASFSGPIWPFAGRFGQRIDRPTPPIALVFFGWVLLIGALLFFTVVLYFKI